MAPAPPTSPILRLDGMHHDGIDVTWEMPQQYGDATVSVGQGQIEVNIMDGYAVKFLLASGMGLGSNID